MYRILPPTSTQSALQEQLSEEVTVEEVEFSPVLINLAAVKLWDLWISAELAVNLQLGGTGLWNRVQSERTNLLTAGPSPPGLAPYSQGRSSFRSTEKPLLAKMLSGQEIYKPLSKPAHVSKSSGPEPPFLLWKIADLSKLWLCNGESASQKFDFILTRLHCAPLWATPANQSWQKGINNWRNWWKKWIAMSMFVHLA